MYHHSNTVLFEPEKCFGQCFFESSTFYRLGFVENSLVQPYEEEWNKYAGYYKSI